MRVRCLPWMRGFALVLLLSWGCKAGSTRGHSTLGQDAAAGSTASVNAPTASAAGSRVSSIAQLRIAADRRETGKISVELAGDRDPVIRAATARALAQIADAEATERLARSLGDDDEHVVAWSAYGLGVACDADAGLDRHARAKAVKALSARGMSLEDQRAKSDSIRQQAVVVAWTSIAWSLGRCGDLEAARELARWLRQDPERARAAALALAFVAARDHGLEDDVAAELLLAARGEGGRAPVDEALYPFTRGDWSARPKTPRLRDVAERRLRESTPGSVLRLFALRAYSRSDGAHPAPLRAILDGAKSADASPTDVIEALRGLHRLGASGDLDVAAFVQKHRAIVADPQLMVSPLEGPISVALELLAERPISGPTRTSLHSFLAMKHEGPLPSDAVVRRQVKLRCLAAVALHIGEPADPDVFHCARTANAHESSDGPAETPVQAELDEIRDHARLSTMERSDVAVTGEKRVLVFRLAEAGALRVRQYAWSICGRHAELGPNPEPVARALASRDAGVVAAAAEALADNVSLGRTRALGQVRQLDAGVAAALQGAMDRDWKEDSVEIKVALSRAAAAVEIGSAKATLTNWCRDRNGTLRRAARDALRRIDPTMRDTRDMRETCMISRETGTSSPHAAMVAPTAKAVLRTDVGDLSLNFDPVVAPTSVSRIVELLRGGFYNGTVIHRVVPGFVVQFGDPGGDGYGGANLTLRCETAPVPFARFDIGVALAGRDTGSSQLFVLLSRSPQLDGSYSWLGHADGNWERVVAGDRILSTRVE